MNEAKQKAARPTRTLQPRYVVSFGLNHLMKHAALPIASLPNRLCTVDDVKQLRSLLLKKICLGRLPYTLH